MAFWAFVPKQCVRMRLAPSGSNTARCRSKSGLLTALKSSQSSWGFVKLIWTIYRNLQSPHDACWSIARHFHMFSIKKSLQVCCDTLFPAASTASSCHFLSLIISRAGKSVHLHSHAGNTVWFPLVHCARKRTRHGWEKPPDSAWKSRRNGTWPTASPFCLLQPHGVEPILAKL